jgi:flavin reductase (DIM6/NTAB) family NADH-FMN oxidoreductase RutF
MERNRRTNSGLPRPGSHPGGAGLRHTRRVVRKTRVHNSQKEEEPMAKRIVDFRECQADTLKAFDDKRVLLVSRGNKGVPNVMTIGWGSLGIIWKKPVFTVLVRHSRHTQPLIEETGEFSVNILPPGMEEVAKYCGTVSGRDANKFEVKQLTAIASSRLKVPLIRECIIHFECRVIYRNDLLPEALDKPILTGIYGDSKDFHRFYFGEIVACQRE